MRRSSAYGEQDPREKELGIDIAGLDEEEQSQANDGIADHGDEAHAEAVRDEAPEGTGDEGDDLVDEAEGADNIANAMVDADEVCDDKGNAAVEKDEEGYGEEGDAEQVADGLGERGGLRKGQMAHEDAARHDGWWSGGRRQKDGRRQTAAWPRRCCRGVLS